MGSRRSRSRSPIRRNSSVPDGSSERYSQSSSEFKSDRKSSTGYGGAAGNNILLIKNLPKTWNFVDIKKFVLANTKSEIIPKNMGYVTMCVDKVGECLVNFFKPEACRAAKEELMGKEVEGRKIFACVDTRNLDKKYIKKNPNTDQAGSRNFRPPPQDPNTIAFPKPIPVPPSLNLETYGLSKNFLHSLGIDPPLINKILIGNLDRSVDESKLREIFSHAGQILHVELLKQDFPKLTAKIEYDHPVEAVQAISMFHNQKLYTRAMNVQLDNKQNNFLPEGLQSFGPGLGPNGAPLKGVRSMVELEPIKKTLMEHVETLKNMDQNPMNSNQPIQIPPNNMEVNNPVQASPIVPPMPMNVLQNPVASFNPNPVNQNPLLGLSNVLNPLQLLQGILQQNTANDGQTMLSALQAVQGLGQNVSGLSQTPIHNQSEWNSQSQPQPQPNLRPNMQHDPRRPSVETNYNNFDRPQPNYDTNPRQFKERKDRGNDNFTDTRIPKYRDVDVGENPVKPSDMLVFNNLPPSVTLQSLSTKMREVGELKFAEMTGQGRAIVRFLNVRDAERCVQLFHHSKVDGDVIEVRFF